MDINFYGNSIEYAIKLPMLAYKINVTESNPDGRRDILANTILQILDVGDKLDIQKIANIIGIPYKYKKLIESEINELIDHSNLIIDEETGTIQNIDLGEDIFASYYVIYDKINKIFMSCIIPEEEFFKRYYKNDVVSKTKSYYINDQYKNEKLDNYTICYQIHSLINKSNKLAELGEDIGNTEEEIEEFLRPFYKIYLEEVENIQCPIECDFLIKISTGKDQEITYEDPFTKESNSIYLNLNIKNKIDENYLKELFRDIGFADIEICKEKSIDYINKYIKMGLNQWIREYIERIALYKELLCLDSDLYKNFPIVSQELDKVVKGILLELLSDFEESKIDKKNICIKNMDDLNEINDIFIISTIINKNIKKIYMGRKVVQSIGEGSIASCLSCIYLSKFFTNSKFESKVFDIFSTDKRLISFLNEVWLYRNNTSHNVEKQIENKNRYNYNYDMEIMQKERLEEVNSHLLEELIYFLDVIDRIKRGM